jgi:hypothetical protein
MAHENDARRRFANFRLVAQCAEQRLREVVDAQNALPALSPVGLVSECVDADIFKPTLIREPEWPEVPGCGRERPGLPAASP